MVCELYFDKADIYTYIHTHVHAELLYPVFWKEISKP